MPHRATMLPPCPVPPAIANAQPPTVFSDGRTAEYTCAFGFRMSGHSRIVCSGIILTWRGTLPSCVKIDEYPHHPVWVYALIAGLLGLIALTFLICLIAYCCGCSPNSVNPFGATGSGSKGGCCRRKSARNRRTSIDEDSVEMADMDRNGAYFIPVSRHNTNKERQQNVRHILISDPKRGHQQVVTNGTFTSDTILVPVESLPRHKPQWLPHSHPLRSNNDSTR